MTFINEFVKICYDKQNDWLHFFFVVESVKNTKKKTATMILSRIDKGMLNNLQDLVFLRYMCDSIPVFKSA